MIVLDRPDGLDLERYRRVVLERRAGRRSPPRRLAAVDAARARMLAHLDGGALAYGVNTGLGLPGRHAPRRRAPGRPSSAPSCVAGRATGRPSRPRSCAARCCCGSPASCTAARASPPRCAASSPTGSTTAGRRGCPSRGITSAGEVIALSAALPDARGRGHGAGGRGAACRRARRCAAAGVAPYEPGVKEGIALVNGAPLAPAAGRGLLAARARGAGRARHARRGALGRARGRVAAALRAPDRAAEGRSGAGGASTRGWRGCTRAAPRGPTAPRRPCPSACSRRCTAPSLDQVAQLDDQVARELRAVTDSPLFLGARRTTSPRASTRAATSTPRRSPCSSTRSPSASTQVGNLASSACTGCSTAASPACPTSSPREPGHQTGLVFLHKAAIGFAAENRLHARARERAPRRHVRRAGGLPGLHVPGRGEARAHPRQPRAASWPPSSSPRARRATSARRRRRRRAARRPSPWSRERVAPVEEDRELSGDVEAVRALLRSGALTRAAGPAAAPPPPSAPATRR